MAKVENKILQFVNRVLIALLFVFLSITTFFQGIVLLLVWLATGKVIIKTFYLEILFERLSAVSHAKKRNIDQYEDLLRISKNGKYRLVRTRKPVYNYEIHKLVPFVIFTHWVYPEKHEFRNPTEAHKAMDKLDNGKKPEEL